MLTLNLEKPGEAPKKLRLSLDKGARFMVTVAWQCEHSHLHDIDLHALEARNDGQGAKVAAIESVLSTYNTKRMNPKGGALANKPDGSFATPGEGLTHTGDVREQGSSETVVIDGTRLAEGINEIPIFVTIHAAGGHGGGGGHGGEEGHDRGEVETFEEIDEATITITGDGGKELGAYRLSTEFKEFNAVQFGSVMLGDNGWEYAAVGRGFKGNFNDVLAQFS